MIWASLWQFFGSLWTSFSSLGDLWDNFGSGVEFCLNFECHFDVIFLKLSVFGGAIFLAFFNLFLETIFPGSYETCVHLKYQREAREKSSAGFLGSRRKTEK